MSDLTPSARKLLADGAPGFGPSAAAREGMRAQVLRHTATAGAAANEAPSSGVRLLLKTHAGKLLGASLFALVAGSYAIVRSSPPSSNAAPSPNVTMEATPSREETPSAETSELASPHQLPEAPLAAAVASPSASAASPSAGRKLDGLPKSSAARPGAPVPASSAETGGSLAAEMRLIRDAQTAFKSGDVALARRKVDEHARSFPDGVLHEERLVLGVLLSCAEGQAERARRTAEELASAHPRSSHLEVLRGSCAGGAISGARGSND